MEQSRLLLTRPHFKTAIFKSFINFLKKNYPEIDLNEIQKLTGLELEYFLNENNWVSLEVERKFVEACKSITGNKELSFEVGKTALNKENIGSLTYYFAKNVVPISDFFDRLPKMTAIVNRVLNVHVIRGESNSVDIEYTINSSLLSNVEVKSLRESFPSIMENIRGYFYAIFELKSLPQPSINYLIEKDSAELPIGRFRVIYKEKKKFTVLRKVAICLMGSSALGLSLIKFGSSVEIFELTVILGLGSVLSVVGFDFMRLKKVADETEKSLERLDSQYSELHQAKQITAEQLNESKLINDVSSALLGVADEESLLNTACEKLIEYIGFDRVVVMLFDPHDNQLHFKVSSGEKAELLQEIMQGFALNLKKVNVSENAITSVFRTGKPVLVNDISTFLNELTEGESRDVLVRSGTTGFVCAPIRTEANKIGLIIADSVSGSRVLNASKLKLVTTVANQMAIFIEKQRAKESLIESYQNEVLLAQSYERFVPFETMQMLNYKSAHDVTIGDGVERTLTIMFSDIRNFTNLCETLSPTDILRFLNSYYNEVAPMIKRNNGIIDKFMGDGLMAIFHNSADAVRAAVEMQRNLVNYNLKRRVGGRKTISVGIGIATGPVIFGPVGSEKRLQLTVLSDTVNLASRLDALCSQYNANIIVSSSTLVNAIENPDLQTREYASVAIKGKNHLVDVVEIIDTNIIKHVNHADLTDLQKLYIDEVLQAVSQRSASANAAKKIA